ncbi:MAG TPA: sterol carrier protein domain-containing protein, partial [Streptosporangiaceae bacterium]
ADPVGWLTREPDVSLRRHKTWMLRVVDPVAAIAGRGFPAGLRAQVPLLLADPDLPGNAGMYLLSVSDGQGSLIPGVTVPSAESPAAGLVGSGPVSPVPGSSGPVSSGPAGSGPVRLGPRGLAALYAGTPMAALRRAGLACGGEPEADDLLDAAFAAEPYLLDYF